MAAEHMFYGNSAAGNARQHIGNVYNNYRAGLREAPEDGSFERGLLDAAETGSEKRVQRYLGYDLQVNFADSQGRTALHLAAKNGYDTIVKSLVAAHCNVDAFSEVYGTALCEAASANRPSIVQLLLEAGADVNAPGGSLHGSAVHAACASGKLPILLLLLDAGASVSATPTIVPKENHNADGSHSPGAIRQYSCTPLYSAIDTGHCHLVPALISAGADVNTTCKKWFESLATNKETTQTTCLEEAPLHCAAANGFGAIVELLLDQGVSIDIKTSDGLTPVMITTIYNRPRCLRMLLDRGAGLDDRDTEEGRGMSALDYAASGGNRECLMTLVNFGAPMDGQDSKGNNALHHACVNGHAACLEALITAGVAVNGSDKKGQRALGPLACAVGAGHVECAEVLIKRGADTHWTDVSKQTALFHASTWACVELLARQEATPDKQQEPNAATRSSWKEKTTRLLVSNNRLNKLANKKLNMNHRDVNGLTPLMYHASCGRHEPVQALLELGAPVDERCSVQERTAIFYASNKQCIDFLLQEKADKTLQDKQGWTALMFHARSGRCESVEALLDAGATRSEGLDALKLAKKAGQQDVMKIFHERGIRPSLSRIFSG